MMSPRSKSLIIGLTGSIGSGKSYVSSLLSECGAVVICADQLAREVVAPGSEALVQITRTFGDQVLMADGTLDRSSLAAIVFQDPEKRRKLEAIIHPRVRERELDLVQQYQGHPLIVLDVPLLFESGFDAECDKTVVVTITEAERERRLLSQRNLSRKELRNRLNAQMPQHEKVARADYIVDNSGTRQQTRHRVNQLLGQLFPDGLPHLIQELSD